MLKKIFAEAFSRQIMPKLGVRKQFHAKMENPLPIDVRDSGTS